MDDKTSDTVIVASRKSNNGSILFRREPHCRRFQQITQDFLTSCKNGMKPCHQGRLSIDSGIVLAANKNYKQLLFVYSFTLLGKQIQNPIDLNLCIVR